MTINENRAIGGSDVDKECAKYKANQIVIALNFWFSKFNGFTCAN